MTIHKLASSIRIGIHESGAAQAFPSQPLGKEGLPTDHRDPGMTLRHYLAGQALTGLCANPSFADGGDLKAMKAQAEYVAAMARMVADATLDTLSTGAL